MRLGREFRHLERLAAQLGLTANVVTRYARGASPVTWLQRLWNTVAGSGRALDRMRPSEIPAALLPLLEQAVGGGARTREVPETRRSNGGRRGPGEPDQPGTPPPPPPGSGQPPPGSDLPPGGFRRSRFNPNYAPPLPGERTPMSDEIVCVDRSSNVYSFAYDHAASTLYVTFQGHKINRDGVRRGTVTRGPNRSRPQLIGRAGSTVTNQRGGRGAMYAYFDVPVRVFERMRSASSVGRFVWDALRIRGTVYGHKYRYTLVQGQVSTQRGVAGVYIPRKATRNGFRSRSVADLGTGRRGFQTSTLPEQNGFRTRSVSNRRRS